MICFKLPFGTVYFLPINRKYIFILGYYDKDSRFMEIFINKYEINPETINERIRNQAETHYQIL